jgi:argonaute-like protein implicated in RNA metabolism and viral defense
VIVSRKLRKNHFRANIDRKALPIKKSTLLKGFASWADLTLSLAEKAKAIPWELVDLPNVDENAVFLGIDLGHDHEKNKSNLGLVLVDHRGHVIRKREVCCPRNNERIEEEVVSEVLPGFVKIKNGYPTHVIVHRDGRYLAEEIEELSTVLKMIPSLSFISIKKSTNTRIKGLDREGTVIRLSQTRAILVTNMQAQHASMPVPIEIELNKSDCLTLDDAIRQIFWLTRVYRGSIYHPKRLPETTEIANNIASTGTKIHTRSYKD